MALAQRGSHGRCRVDSMLKEETGLVKYDSMCQAIAAAHDVDEAKEIRDKAMALEVYAQQAMNMQAELRAREIRLRAERKTGQLLKALQKGKGGGDGSNQHEKSNSVHGARSCSEYAEAVANANLSEDQARRFQRLAKVDDDTFEAALSDPDEKPTTSGILRKSADSDSSPVSDESLWLWGRIKDFERNGILESSAEALVLGMNDKMISDVADILQRLIPFAEKAKEVADEIIFMDEGRIIEGGTADHFFTNPQEDRTKLFLSQIL